MAVTFTPTVISNPSGVQGEYPLRLTAGHEGLIADLRSYDTKTGVNIAAGALPIGALVQLASAPDRLELADDTALTTIQGILTDQYTYEQAGVYSNSTYPTIAADGRPGLPPKHSGNVMTRGVIWVYAAEAIAVGDPVRFFNTNYSGTLAGAFQGRFGTSAVADNTVLATSGFRYDSATAAAGLVRLSFNMEAAAFTADT